MTMDYHHPYNVYPEYYNPAYQGTGCQYPQQQMIHHSQQQHYVDQRNMPGPEKNFNSNSGGPPSHSQHYHLPYQQRQQPYLPTFQQHYQQQQRSNYSSPYLPNFLVSSGTGLTPTLTPTTLATIEQSFLELQSAQQNRGWDSVTQSGFVPPVIDAGDHSTEVSQDSQEYSSEFSDGEWEPQVKRGRVSQVMKDIKNVNLIVTSTGTINAAPQRKYTRRNKDEKLAPEEEEKRRVRRERNKLAAAKCRQRRVDHTNILVAETEKLEAEQSQLESEIQSLQQEKDQLEFILQAHQPLCKVDQSRSLSGKVKTEPGSRPPTCKSHCFGSHDASCLMPENLSMSASSSASAVTNGTVSSSAASATTSSSSQGSSEASVFNSRPNSLPLIKRERAHMLSSATSITINTPTSGVTITPSSLFCPGLDSMVDGSTGLTPLTGGVSCSSQVQRNSSESGSEAESTLISL